MPKKAANTNKTAHVMNLISKHAEPTEAAEAPSEATETAAPAAPAAPAAILPSLNADKAVSSQIQSALEGLLETAPDEEPTVSAAPAAETTAAVPAAETPVEEPTVSAAPAAETTAAAPAAETPDEESTVSAAPAAEMPVAEPAPVEEPAPAAEPAAEPAPAAAPAAETPAEEPADELVCVNIMEALVDQSIHRYIDMFGLCSCPRCVADVKALALNELIPKYIVTPQNERNPRVIIYNERYHAEVTAQILHACKKVMDNPLHE